MLTSRIYTPAPTAALQFLNPVGMFRNLWSSRELIWQFAWREVRQRYQGSYLGVVWSVLSPLLMLAVYTFVFSEILKVKWPKMVSDSKAEFALILFTGLIINGVFAECASRAPMLVVGQPNFVKKVVFPLEVLPVVALTSALLLASVTFVILGLLAGLLLTGFSWTQLLLIPIILPAIFLSLGAGWWLSALGVFLRDIGHFVPVALQVLTFMTPVFFSLTSVPAPYRWILQLHPMTAVIEGARKSLLWHELPDWGSWGISLGVSFVFMVLGYVFFMKSKRAFADVL